MYYPHLLLLDELVWATWALCYFAALLTEWGLLFNIFCVLIHFYLNVHSTSPTSLILMWQVVYLYITCLLIAQIIIFFFICVELLFDAYVKHWFQKYYVAFSHFI
jgi:hypothetical protein